MQCRHIIITAPPTHWRITSRNLPFQKTGRLAAHLMPHEVYTDTVYPHCYCYCAGDQSIPVAVLLPGNVCSSFSIWTCRQPQNGRFWLSAGLEYLPSGIPGLAAAAALRLCPHWTGIPTSTSSHQSIISWRWQQTTSLSPRTKPNPQQFMDFYNLWKNYQVMACWTTSHKWRYAQTSSALIRLTGTALYLGKV